jgi:sugar phosphate isomerase/epimerase
MGKMKSGFIGFIPFTAKGEDYYSRLEQYAKIGYKGFEQGNGLFDGDVDANLARVKGYGIEPICMGVMAMPGMPAPDLGKIAEQCHKIGVKRAVTYVSIAAQHRFGMRPTPATYDEVMKEIEGFEKTAAFFKGEGIKFMFHNHDTEVAAKFSGKSILELMYANTDDLSFELDVGWVTYGGGNPVDYINRFRNRISALHIKDFTDGWVQQISNFGPKTNYKNMMPRFTTPGTGKLDLYGCLKAGSDLGIEWAIVEQDFQYNLTEKETLTAAYLNMKETGLVE